MSYLEKIGVLLLFWGVYFLNAYAAPLPASAQEWLSQNVSFSEYNPQSKLILDECKKQFADFSDKTHPPQAWIDWLVLGQWLSFANPNEKPFQSPDKSKAFIDLAQTKVPYLFLTYRLPQDKLYEAIDILCRLQARNPSGVKELPALAVAFSIVHDAPFPRDWPHHQVDQNDLPKGDYSIEEHFDFFVNSQHEGRLQQDFPELSVSQLKFVVDSKIPISELDWAQKNVKATRGQFDNVFSSIEYDQERLKKAQYDWSGGEYTLAAIRKKGGICVDQAYFASIAGKAKGIPTLYFSGQGTQGGHAWIGFLKSSDKWEMDAGRYSNQNYCVGYAMDPQIWKEINDSQLKQLSDKVEDIPDYNSYRFIFNWLLQNSNEPFFASTVEALRDAMPDYAPFWRACASKVVLDSKSDDEKIAFWEKWILQFTLSPDLKVEGQESLCALYEKLGKTTESAELKKLIISQNKRKRFDIGIESESQEMIQLLKNQKYDEAKTLYKKLVQNYDDKAGGMLFYQVIKPYVFILLEVGESKEAIEGYKFASKHLTNLSPDSIIAKQMETLRLHLEKQSGTKIR